MKKLPYKVRYGLKLAVGVACGFFLAFLIKESRAMTILGNDDSCNALADNAYVGAMERDAGTPWEVFHLFLAQALSEAKGDKDSIVKDDDDVRLIIGVFHQIWESKSTPDQVRDSVWKGCVTHAAGVSK